MQNYYQISLSLSAFQYQMHRHDDISIMKGLGKSWQIATDVSEEKGPLNVFSRIEKKSSWHWLTNDVSPQLPYQPHITWGFFPFFFFLISFDVFYFTSRERNS